ncbi:MAG TPA: LysR family transcriptional regulator [Polyangiales bacterium]
MLEHPPPLELLPALHALIESESVTQAARQLHVGQPAMSRTLERLRAALGDELLVREGRRMVRTRRAAELLPELTRLLASARQVFAQSSAFNPGLARGVVTLALGDDMQAMLSGALLERLRGQAPGLDVRVRPLTLQSAQDAQRGAIELAVLPDLRSQYAIPTLDELVLSPQYTRRFVVVSRKRRALDLAAFVRSEHVLVSPQGEEGGYVDDALRLLGQRRRVAVAVPSFLAALSLVQTSSLIATLPDDVVRVLAPRLYRQPCPVTTPELPMCIGWAARFNQDERHRWLREQVREVVKQRGA